MAAHAKGESGEVPPLWRVLDLILDAHAVAVDCDPEVARFVLMSVLVLGERLALSDEVVHRMLTSAAAEARRSKRRD